MPRPHTGRANRITLRPMPPAHTSSPTLIKPLGIGFSMRCSPKVDGSVTLGRWLDIWMSSQIEPNRADTTVNGYNGIIRNHVVPALGAVRLTDLSPDLLRGYYQWLEEERGLSPNTVRKHHVLLHTALKLAFQQGIIPNNPVQRVTPPQPTTVNIRYYTPAQLRRLLEAVDGHALELPVKLACYLGLRRSEILGLRWRDVDLEAGLLSIRRVRTTVGYRIVEKGPKTRDSRRTLSIRALDGLMSLLRRLASERPAAHIPCGPDDFLALNERGLPWHPNLMSYALSSLLTSHGLDPVTFHGLRHTFASMANDARVPMYQISRAMGHSSPNTTQRIYTHLFDQTHGDVLAAVADSIDRCASDL